MDISWVFPADSINGDTANTASTESNTSGIYPNNTITEEDLEQLTVVEISEDTAYNKKEDVSQTGAQVGAYRDVSFGDNIPTSNGRGTCTAATVVSILLILLFNI
jgi:hypothetical protein